MPIYEYECVACGHLTEVMQGINDTPARKCPECGKLKLKRLVSQTQFKLKGTGWYETDFKKSDKSNKMSDESKATDKPSDKSSDSKTETTSSTKTDSSASSTE